MVFKRGNVTLEEDEGRFGGVLGVFEGLLCVGRGNCCLCRDRGYRSGLNGV